MTRGGFCAERRDERGQSLSVFVLLIAGALVLTLGLVIDGGQKVTATARAEAAAAGAARAAGNAAATQQLGGRAGTSSALLAARAYLAGAPGVAGGAALHDGVVTVHTTVSQPTLVLSLLGIDRISGTGSADASIVPSGRSR